MAKLANNAIRKSHIFVHEDYEAKFTLNHKMTNNVEDKKHNVPVLNLKQNDCDKVKVSGGSDNVTIKKHKLS